MRTFSLGFSTCPNDTYIFGGLAQGDVLVEGAGLDIILADVEELNRWAIAGGPDICKVSVAAAASMLDDYWLLRSGGAMGFGVGPLLVASEFLELAALEGATIAVPGRMTTATLLLGLMLREADVTVTYDEMIFHEVMDAVLAGKARGGVIIHEGRFTYAQRGLVKLADLGAWWEESRSLPIPLGCIAIRRSLGEDIAKAVNQGIRSSLELARSNEKQVWGYIKQLAKEMADEVVREHIRTFVTEYSMDVGVEGERAVSAILAEACLARGGTLPELPLFVPAD